MLRFVLYPLFDSYLFVLLIAAVFVGLMLYFRPQSDRIASKRRRILIGLRIAVILLLMFAMLRPTVIYTQTRKLAATLVLLVDDSRSMGVADEMNGRTRWATIAGGLQMAADSIARMQKQFEVNAYTFDSEPRQITVQSGQLQFNEQSINTVTPEGNETAIGHALDQTIANEAGKRILAVIMASDGAQRTRAPRDLLPQDAAIRLRDAACPLYTIPVGKARGLGQTRDVAVKDLGAPARVFVNNEMLVTAQVRIDGYVNRDIPVELKYEITPGQIETVARKTVRATAGSQLVPLEFRYMPEQPGEHKLSIEIPAQSGELVETNNVMSTFVHVLKGGLRVLYLEGTHRIEQKFIRRALAESPDIEVDYFRLDAQHPETAPPELGQMLASGDYAVVILGDLDSSALPAAQWSQLAESVARGTGLIMLGGFHSFGPGGYGQSPLADVLPVEMTALDRQSFNEPPREDLHIAGPLRMRLTDIGASHFALRLAPSIDGNRRAWEELPEVDGANRFFRVKPTAVVLAETPEGQPILIRQLYGSGRVLAFGIDSTWRWWMHGAADSHKRFWRQIVLWLAKKDESLEGNVWVRLANRSISVGSQVEFSLGAQTAIGDPIPDAMADVQVTMPDGSQQSVSVSRHGTELTGLFLDTTTPGDYRIEAVLSQGGQMLGQASARFVVVAHDMELDNATADPDLLDSIATMTGGRSLAPEELPELVDELIRSTESLEEVSETKQPLWDNWLFYLLFVTLLAVEWYLRKRWGMV